MATRTKRGTPPKSAVSPVLAARAAIGGQDGGSLLGAPETTGRFIVVFKSNGASRPESVKAALSNIANVSHVAGTSDFARGAITAEAMAEAPAVHFERLGIVVVTNPD